MVSAFLVVVLLASYRALACSSVMVPHSRTKVMGKNYDWFWTHGRVFVNRKNMTRRALVAPGLKPHVWTARHASVTFNQIAEHFPMGGMNSAGVAMEILMGPADYPATSRKPAINELQFIQFILDTSATVKEAVERARTVEIIPMSGYHLHYHACDRTGQCVVFEYNGGKLAAHFEKDSANHDNPFVLTNGRFSRELKARGEIAPPVEGKAEEKQLREILEGRATTTDDELFSPRVRTACQMAAQYPRNPDTDDVAFMLGLLERIKLFPQWQIIYQLGETAVQFRSKVTESSWSPLRRFSFAAFPAKDVDCRTSPGASRRFDLSTDGPEKSVVLEQTDFATEDKGTDLISQSDEILRHLPAQAVQALRNYSKIFTKCEIAE
ncbi:MAG: linear amide C-N hydrolase [Deltaproteobacteria bacterium]|nr:linear amide C-N hydrolase [Deltaproteobacteria bacterium]MBI3295811.1 linear amide C-N hydrolase [Deltaproteobacteria bacterium]